MDVLGDYASPLPSRVTGQFFGMSGQDGERCWRWSATMMQENVEHPDLAQTAAVEFFEFLQETIDEARQNPKDTHSSMRSFRERFMAGLCRMTRFWACCLRR